MDLHRTKGKPDWADVPADKQNIFQRIAATTRGLGTPSNLVTLLGFGLVVYGLALIMQHQYLAGGVVVAIGRLCDVADGWLAQATGTKSPLGELLDAGIDKITTVLTVIIFYIADVAPLWALAALLLPHVIIVLIILWAMQQQRRVHPSLIGKFSMAAAWISMVGFLVMAGITEPPLLAAFVYGLTALSAVLGLIAATGYALDREFV